jgi:DNA-binding response OmpR family regulator
MNNILLIEDDATMRALLKTLLELEGHHVTPVIDPQQDILQIIRDEKPNFVILDVNLRHANGIEILKSIRKMELSWKLHILMTSGMDFKEESLQAGADGFLLKPYMPDELIRQLKNVQST